MIMLQKPKKILYLNGLTLEHWQEICPQYKWNQGRIQTESGSVQALWPSKEMSPKMKIKKRKWLLSDKFLK